ncbi:MAG: hypothetical protein ACHQAU_03245, partial [Gammaproteobacteria bacterium]
DNTLLQNGSVQFKFAPAEHVGFFQPFGWRPGEYRDSATVARRLKRIEIPVMYKLIGTIMSLHPGVRAKMKTFSGIAALDRV